MDIDAQAHAAATSPLNDLPEPTEAQKKAGTYTKGHAHVLGMRLSIENPAGSTRRGKDKEGNAWESKLAHHYGYLRGTQGADKDHIDVFLGPDPRNAELPVHVVDQVDPDTGEFDEHKVLLGFPDEDSALEAYHANYPGEWKGADSVTAMPLKDFKAWAFNGKKTEPAAESYRAGGRVGYADGGAVEDLSRPYFGNPNITRQGQKAGVQARSSAADPLTTFFDGLLGTAPDEMGLSVLDPRYKDARATGEVGFNIGTAAQMLPFVGPALKGAGALTRLGTPAAKYVGRAGRGALEELSASMGARRPAYVPAGQLGAVKLKGGNWSDAEPVGLQIRGLGYNTYDDVKAWRDKNLTKYIKNQMGTKDDPLLALEREGRMHMTPEDLAERADENYKYPMKNAAGHYDADRFHIEQTGRNYRTPWEALSDSTIVPGDVYEEIQLFSRNPQKGPEWLDKADPRTPVYRLDDERFGNLGFDHVQDYLTDAYKAGMAGPELADPQGLHPWRPDEAARLYQLYQRGLHLTPEQLARTSVADAVAKTHEWDKLLGKAKQLGELNKGIKQVHKQYPTGHQWVELAPEGLQAEGAAMRHCVGGYCNSVEDGSTRILSLRDAEGKPAVTVEVTQPDHNSWMQTRANRSQEEAWIQRLKDEGLYGRQDQQKAIADVFRRWAPTVGIDMTPVIQQIKGPANRAPSKEVLQHVQDLVRGGVPGMEKWGRVNDLNNTNLVELKGGTTNIRYMNGVKTVPMPEGFLTRSELADHFMKHGIEERIARQHAGDFEGLGFAHGGRVGYYDGGGVGSDGSGDGTGSGASTSGGDVSGGDTSSSGSGTPGGDSGQGSGDGTGSGGAATSGGLSDGGPGGFGLGSLSTALGIASALSGNANLGQAAQAAGIGHSVSQGNIGQAAMGIGNAVAPGLGTALGIGTSVAQGNPQAAGAAAIDAVIGALGLGVVNMGAQMSGSQSFGTNVMGAITGTGVPGNTNNANNANPSNVTAAAGANGVDGPEGALSQVTGLTPEAFQTANWTTPGLAQQAQLEALYRQWGLSPLALGGIK